MSVPECTIQWNMQVSCSVHDHQSRSLCTTVPTITATEGSRAGHLRLPSVMRLMMHLCYIRW